MLIPEIQTNQAGRKRLLTVCAMDGETVLLYYCVSRALLTRAGIPNIEVTRVQGYGHHWWNMAYVNGGFYHFDTCPRKAGGRFCLVTDAQLKKLFCYGRQTFPHLGV